MDKNKFGRLYAHAIKASRGRERMERRVSSTRESSLGGRSTQGGRRFARFGFGLLFAILGAGMIVGVVLALSLPDVPVSDPPTPPLEKDTPTPTLPETTTTSVSSSSSSQSSTTSNLETVTFVMTAMRSGTITLTGTATLTETVTGTAGTKTRTMTATDTLTANATETATRTATIVQLPND